MSSVYQAIFTRVGGQELSAGWQVACKSPDLPPDAEHSFALMQSANFSDTPASGSGTQSSLELQADGRFYYLTRVWRGLTDNMGRPSGCAHGLILPFAENPLLARDPSPLLCVPDTAFTRQTGPFHLPKAPTLAPVPSQVAERAVQDAGMTDDRLRALLICVFQTLLNPAHNTLHILHTPSEAHAKSLLLCLYALLPYALRGKLTFSIGGGRRGMDPRLLVFDSGTAEDVHAFDYRTGENNVLTDAVRRRWERYHFMEFPLVCRQNGRDPAVYFDQLDRILEKFGRAQDADPDAMELAHNILRYDNPERLRNRPDAELLNLLSGALTCRAQPADELDAYVTTLIEIIAEKKVNLNEAQSRMLRKLFAAGASPALQKALVRLFIWEAPPEQACATLEGWHAEPCFADAERLLRENPEGRKILDHYYAQYEGPRRMRAGTDYEDLTGYYVEKAVFLGHSELDAFIREGLLSLYRKDLRQNLRDAPAAYRRYTDALRKVLAEPASGSLIQLQQDARAFFWEIFPFEQTSAADRPLYESMSFLRAQRCIEVLTLSKNLALLQAGNGDDFENWAEKCFSEKNFPDSDLAIAKKLLLHALRENPALCWNLDLWLAVDGAEEALQQFLAAGDDGVLRLPNAVAASRRLQDAAVRGHFRECLQRLTKAPGRSREARRLWSALNRAEKQARRPQKTQNGAAKPGRPGRSPASPPQEDRKGPAAAGRRAFDYEKEGSGEADGVPSGPDGRRESPPERKKKSTAGMPRPGAGKTGAPPNHGGLRDLLGHLFGR